MEEGERWRRSGGGGAEEAVEEERWRWGRGGGGGEVEESWRCRRTYHVAWSQLHQLQQGDVGPHHTQQDPMGQLERRAANHS